MARSLGVRSQEQWWAVTREQSELLLKLRIPARPHLFYRKEWKGYDEWLGLPETLPSPRGRRGHASGQAAPRLRVHEVEVVAPSGGGAV